MLWGLLHPQTNNSNDPSDVPAKRFKNTHSGDDLRRRSNSDGQESRRPDRGSQQASACFINSVQDSMESILDLAKTEGMLFKFGSGTGTNLSVLRSSKEQLSGGGTASGPVSFMKGYDSFAGSI